MIKGNQIPFVFLIVIGLATGTHSFAAQDVLEDQYFDSNGSAFDVSRRARVNP